MGSIKEINIKSWTSYFFYYYIEYITMKDFDYVKINRLNPFYLITGKVDGYIKEKIGNKY